MNPLPTALLTALVLASCASSPPSPAIQSQRILEAFEKAAAAKGDRRGAGILVHSGRLGLHAEARHRPEQPESFHAASIGKTFTAVLVAKLVDAGRITFDSPVAPLLAPGTLDGLFVVGGVDHQDQVTVRHLLAHTSGVADYFADPRLLTQDPDRLWTPDTLLEYTRTQQKAIGKPGERYYYSDTGYLILGLVVEALQGRPFHEVLSTEIFDPLGMDRTFMPYRSHPRTGTESLREAWIRGVEVSRLPAITVDWSGGGIATTEGDLLRFQQALRSGALVSDKVLAEMELYNHRFQEGIWSGLGLMELRFGEFFFLLDGLPQMQGHMGILSTYAFYDKTRDLHIILTLGTEAALEDGIRLIIDVLTIVAGG